MFRKIKILAFIICFIATIQAKESTQSYFNTTTSNGSIVAVYNEKKAEVTSVFPHIFAYYDSAQSVRPFMESLCLKTRLKPWKTSYRENTHVIEVDYHTFRVFYFASFTNDNKVFYAVIRGKKSAIKNLKFKYKKNYCKVYQYGYFKSFEKYDEKYFLFSFDDLYNKNLSAIKSAQSKIASTKESLIEKETRFMKQLFAKCHYPPHMTSDEKNAFEQSISVLKMAQVTDSEIFNKSHGQILASLKPGVWAISWVRDASFAIEAMSRLGMYVEAKKGLEFMLKASPTAQYIKFIYKKDHKDYGVGMDYQISVTRYYGNGREEADYSGADSPNIELDGFGLFLTAFYNYIYYSSDTAFVSKWYNVITKKIANPILHNIAANGLIRNESGPWEHHLPGNQYAFTTAVCARGLELLNQCLLQTTGKGNELYYQKADEMKQAILKNLLYKGLMFKGNAQVRNPIDPRFYDGATYEMFANKLFTDSTLVYNHFKGFESKLRVSPERGYIRIAGNDSYENQEWPFLSLRIASIHTYFGKKTEAKCIIDWNTRQAKCNYNLFPEIYGLDNMHEDEPKNQKSGNITYYFAKYKGAIPMVGYGAAAYILALSDYYGLK